MLFSWVDSEGMAVQVVARVFTNGHVIRRKPLLSGRASARLAAVGGCGGGAKRRLWLGGEVRLLRDAEEC